MPCWFATTARDGSTSCRCSSPPTARSPPSAATFAGSGPNIVIDGVDGTDEFGWPGAELHIGDVVIALDSRRGRCPMTTVDPDTLEVDRGVLKDIITRFDGKLALNAEVLRPGTIRVGDPVELVRPTSSPMH